MSLRQRARLRLGYAKKKLTQPSARFLDQRPDLTAFDIGRHSWGHLTIANRSPGCQLTVGSFCSFAAGTRVILGGEHRADYVSTYRFGAYPPFNERYQHPKDTAVARGDITIGNDVWIGHDAMILSGVTVGDGAIIGAGAVVRSDVPPYGIVAGNPGRVAGFRFPPEQIEALLRIRWWEWSDDQIVAALPAIMSEDTQAFIDTYDVTD